jgi:DNA-binding NarL/FixJ family response regulator
MLVHVAVADPLAPYAEGLTTMLRARGASAEAPTDLEAWAGQNQVKIIFLTLASEPDWQRLKALRLLDDRLLIVAVMDVMAQTACVRALTSGAVSILPRDTSAQAALQTVDSLARGESVVPLSMVRALAGQLPPAGDEPESEEALSSKELDWLRQLAQGVTVRQLANSAGYSERMMFRILRSLYQRMNVATRTEALFLARERGWI